MLEKPAPPTTPSYPYPTLPANDSITDALLGEPTPVMQALGRSMEAMITIYKVRSFFDSLNRHPKEEPFKRYLYDTKSKGSNGSAPSAVPYRVEVPTPSPEMQAAMRRTRLVGTLLKGVLKTVRIGKRAARNGDIDDFLVNRISNGWLGFGF
jgi:hypothetical protein